MSFETEGQHDDKYVLLRKYMLRFPLSVLGGYSDFSTVTPSLLKVCDFLWSSSSVHHISRLLWQQYNYTSVLSLGFHVSVLGLCEFVRDESELLNLDNILDVMATQLVTVVTLDRKKAKSVASLTLPAVST